MAVFEFSLDKARINTSSTNVWLKQAAITLSEALVLCAGRLLDIEFNEIKSGYRIRYDKDTAYLDVFLFDSLSSGAGYCAMVADLAGELLKSTYSFLNSCDCEMSCHKCLNHYWNKRYQEKMNRRAAGDVIRYCMTNQIADPFSAEEQKKRLKSLIALIESDDSSSINVTNEGDSVYVENGKAKKQLYVYPAMWTKANSIIPKDSFAVSDMEIKYALSKVYLRLMKELEDGSTNTSEPATPFSEIEIRKKEGVDLASLDFLGKTLDFNRRIIV